MAKNIQMNVLGSDGQYEDIYPQTLSENVIDLQDNYYNKEQILTQTVSDMFEISSGNPNDVFEFLGKYNQYWWKRRSTGYIEKKTLVEDERMIALTILKIQCSDNINIDTSGNITLNSPITITVTQSNVTNRLKYKYFYPSQDGESDTSIIYYMGTGVSVNFNGDELFVSPLYEVTSGIGVGDWEYIRSSDRSAYPDSGEQDGYEYQYLGVPFENLLYISKIETGSYIGTGKYGKSNPNSLTFGFEPKLVLISNNINQAFNPSPLLYFYGIGSDSLRTISLSGNTLSWYSTTSAFNQLNVSANYTYLAIGTGGGGVTEQPTPEPGLGVTFHNGENGLCNFTWNEAYITREDSGAHTILHVAPGGLMADIDISSPQQILFSITGAVFDVGASLDTTINYTSGTNAAFDFYVSKFTDGVNIYIG